MMKPIIKNKKFTLTNFIYKHIMTTQEKAINLNDENEKEEEYDDEIDEE